MTIPISYNLRNLVARRTTTVMTALGIGLTVAVLLALLAMVEGLRTALEAGADPRNVLVLRKGSTAELNSFLTRQGFQDLKYTPGIARGADGEPLASLEVVTVIVLEGPENPGGMNVTLRGLLPVGFRMREGIRIAQGKMFETGKREIVVGKGIAARYPGTRVGGTLRFGRGEWTIVGIMDAGRSASNSEIFADLNQLSADYDRGDALSSALVRAVDDAAVPPLIQTLENDRRLNMSAQTELAYYQGQMVSAAPIRVLGVVVALIMAVGSSFAAMNTMYAAVSRRAAEIGTLRVLGFSRAGILASFLIESLLLSLMGGLVGCLLALPLNNLTTGIGSFVTFSEITFNLRITPAAMAAGIAFALLMGALGGLLPAGSAARKQILTALRGV